MCTEKKCHQHASTTDKISNNQIKTFKENAGFLPFLWEAVNLLMIP